MWCGLAPVLGQWCWTDTLPRGQLTSWERREKRVHEAARPAAGATLPYPCSDCAIAMEPNLDFLYVLSTFPAHVSPETRFPPPT